MFSRILIPTDFSTASEWVFDDAVRIAGTHGAEILILHVRMTWADHPDQLRFRLRDLQRDLLPVRIEGLAGDERVLHGLGQLDLQRAPLLALRRIAVAVGEAAELGEVGRVVVKDLRERVVRGERVDLRAGAVLIADHDLVPVREIVAVLRALVQRDRGIDLRDLLLAVDLRPGSRFRGFGRSRGLFAGGLGLVTRAAAEEQQGQERGRDGYAGASNH